MTLTKEYFLSDCYGGPTSPYEAPDPDALIATDLRGRPQQPSYHQFDTARAPFMAHHLVRHVTGLVDAQLGQHGVRRLTPEVRVMVNSAPRSAQAEGGEYEKNGSHFYLAKLDNGVKLVVTPLDVLSSIKGRVKALYRLPNKDNGLFPNGEQFRSSYVPALFNVDMEHGEQSGITLHKCDAQETIPEWELLWHLSYVDRFGNVVTYKHDQKLPPQINDLDPNNLNCSFNLCIGGQVRPALRGTNLSEARYGALTVYPNDHGGNIDVIRKMSLRQTEPNWRYQTAWGIFGSPELGVGVGIER